MACDWVELWFISVSLSLLALRHVLSLWMRFLLSHSHWSSKIGLASSAGWRRTKAGCGCGAGCLMYLWICEERKRIVWKCLVVTLAHYQPPSPPPFFFPPPPLFTAAAGFFIHLKAPSDWSVGWLKQQGNKIVLVFGVGWFGLVGGWWRAAGPNKKINKQTWGGGRRRRS